MGAMRGRKGVVDIDVAERGKLLGEVWIVFLLAVVVTKIFEQSDLARLERIAGDLRAVALPAADTTGKAMPDADDPSRTPT